MSSVIFPKLYLYLNSISFEIRFVVESGPFVLQLPRHNVDRASCFCKQLPITVSSRRDMARSLIRLLSSYNHFRINNTIAVFLRRKTKHVWRCHLVSSLIQATSTNSDFSHTSTKYDRPVNFSSIVFSNSWIIRSMCQHTARIMSHKRLLSPRIAKRCKGYRSSEGTFCYSWIYG